MFSRTSIPQLLALSVVTFSPLNQAAELEITLTNLTQGIYFTPILIAAHSADSHLFEVATAASNELQMMAEGGDISGLVSILSGIDSDFVDNPAAGLLMPASSTSTMLSTSESNTMLSITAMLLPTNDGFVGLDSWQIPSEPGTYHIYLNAYDAGTEANDEIVNGGGAPNMPGIPASPGGAGVNGSGVTDEQPNTMVHIHPGNIGDDQADGGSSDLDSRVQRWLNPVAHVTVIVK